MIEIRQTEVFENWLARLRDDIARKHVGRRLARLQIGLFGDTRSVGGKVFELRIDHGPGYRVYFARQGKAVLILLCGGDKSSQERDIERARTMAAELDE